MTQPNPLIYGKIIAVMKDIDAIAKSRKNAVQGYNFRGIDDVYNELHTPLAEHGVFTIPEILEERTEERTTSKGSSLIYRILKIKFTFYAEDGSNVAAIVIGEGMDSGDKASNKAMSVAHKYALMQVFAIATEDEKDPEINSHEVKPILKAVQTQKIFDSKNLKHREWLEGYLTKKQIAKDMWPAIFDPLEGKDFKELDAIIKKVII